MWYKSQVRLPNQKCGYISLYIKLTFASLVNIASKLEIKALVDEHLDRLTLERLAFSRLLI